jgi:two-component system C4-dicarboxylate transport sensor histidine kinase DctB
MTDPSAEQARTALLVAASRAALYGTVSRWLMHDLRGPAQALALVTDLLEQGDTLDEPSVRASLQEASGRLHDLLLLLDQVLRQPDGNDELRPILLREPLGTAVSLVRLQRSNVTLDAEPALCTGLPAVRGVEEHILQALLSVLVNAYEAMASRGRGTVRVWADARGDVVRITIADDGPGVHPEVERRLFEPFVSTKAGRPLAGLGLWAARELLRRSGGALQYERPARGAAFVLALPAWRPD